MNDTSQLVWGLLFGAVGLAFLTYGKQQKALIPLLSGIGLLVFPYFVSNLFMLVGIGGVLAALPWFVRL